jgi:hypothetical protein
MRSRDALNPANEITGREVIDEHGPEVFGCDKEPVPFHVDGKMIEVSLYR